MSRWTVYKAGRHAWTAHRKGELPGNLFHTWREAQDWADRQARTREYTLPRMTENNAIIPGAIGLFLEPGRNWNGARNTWVKDGVGMIYVPSYDLRPLALALLALAEQEESCHE